MLMITRVVGEYVKIGDDITVIVMGVDGNQIKLGFDAPKEVDVYRGEIYDQRREGIPPKKHGR